VTAAPSAPARREMTAVGQPAANDGQRWTMAELAGYFEVIGFAATLVVVRRRSDGQLGTLEFTHHPRAYFGRQLDNE
jgi:hypothetical protein